jgi:cyclin G-associated kinase
MTQSKSSSDLNGLNFNAFGPATTPAQNLPRAEAGQPPFRAFGAEKEKPKDPFADLGNLGGSLNSGWGSTNKTTPSPNYSQYSSPSHQFGQATSASTSPKAAPSTPKFQPQPQPQTQPQMKSPSDSQRPDYSRSNFVDPNAVNQNTNQKPKSFDIFGDILGQQGYSFGAKGSQGPRTINDMRKEELARDMDPERLKIMEWVRFFWNLKKIQILLIFCLILD